LVFNYKYYLNTPQHCVKYTSHDFHVQFFYTNKPSLSKMAMQSV